MTRQNISGLQNGPHKTSFRRSLVFFCSVCQQWQFCMSPSMKQFLCHLKLWLHHPTQPNSTVVGRCGHSTGQKCRQFTVGHEVLSMFRTSWLTENWQLFVQFSWVFRPNSTQLNWPAEWDHSARFAVVTQLSSWVEISVIFVLIYFLVLVLVFQLFFRFSFVLVLQYFFVFVLVLPTTK